MYVDTQQHYNWWRYSEHCTHVSLCPTSMQIVTGFAGAWRSQEFAINSNVYIFYILLMIGHVLLEYYCSVNNLFVLV